MSLTEQLKAQMKQAMVAKEKARLSTIRMALAAIKQVEVDTRETLTDEQVIAVLTKMVKQRRDAIEQYQAAGRPELAAAEEAEVLVLKEFLPQPLSDDELHQIIDAAIKATGASSIADMGKVMGLVKNQVLGRANMGAVSTQIKAKLQ
ncbi:GatB/YqeY domain-containing protein [Shewanella dokdonensis]|uniref:GatB/YqeY domain-containing protein n=1 Tax=Shewanella dokdonensis TaxID=712036 RepID=A0ABX8DFX4_9GAMM|nr:GatB/YqeY domain-containing protein [Shewanella dokdonensis]MCL1073857.1 GatB/YqeY domain-containing protein [Shewanella dokdonensis]QVK23639.1 GatB/YqeY domain-containing protein [Shewanella dokdonensis]